MTKCSAFSNPTFGTIALLALLALVFLHGLGDDAQNWIPSRGSISRNLKADDQKSSKDPHTVIKNQPSKAARQKSAKDSQTGVKDQPSKAVGQKSSKGSKTGFKDQPSKAVGQRSPKDSKSIINDQPSRTEGQKSKDSKTDIKDQSSTAQGHKSSELKRQDNTETDTFTSNDDHESSTTKEDEQPIYDEKGWHIEGEDFVSKVMHPEELQPFYIQPVFFAVKLILTMTIFGFSLRFQRPTKNGGCIQQSKDAVAKIGKIVAGLAFIALALNGYYHDYGVFSQHQDGVTTTGKRLGVFLITWVTSGNYVACRAVWGSLMVENPIYLLGLTPNYAAVPVVGIPLCPGGAAWLDPLKHLYALILLPYFLPYYAVNYLQGCVLCIWLCSTKCIVLWSSLVGSVNCGCALFGVIFTLGLVAWIKNALVFWWGLESPIYYQLLIQVWATLIAPTLFSLIYGLMLCTSLDQLGEGLAKGQQAMLGMLAGQPMFKLSDDDAEHIKAFNKDKLVGFSGYELVDQDLQDGGESAGPKVKLDSRDLQDGGESADPKAQLDDSKIQIFQATLFKMSSIVAEQLAIIFLVRALSDAADYDHYIGALKMTITERTWASYSAHLHKLAQESTSKVANALYILL